MRKDCDELHTQSSKKKIKNINKNPSTEWIVNTCEELFSFKFLSLSIWVYVIQRSHLFSHRFSKIWKRSCFCFWSHTHTQNRFCVLKKKMWIARDYDAKTQRINKNIEIKLFIFLFWNVICYVFVCTEIQGKK